MCVPIEQVRQYGENGGRGRTVVYYTGEETYLIEPRAVQWTRFNHAITTLQPFSGTPVDLCVDGPYNIVCVEGFVHCSTFITRL